MSQPDLTTAYARDVADDHIVAGELVKLACRRHLADLELGYARGLHFEPAVAQRAISFFGFLKHSKGKWAGAGFSLEGWQAFIVGSLFGWLRADDTRRFRIAYNQVARKNGKSTLAAGIGLYLFIADKEAGAEVYSAATKRDQARIVHSEAVRMVKASETLRGLVRVFKDNLNIEATNSKYEPLGADEDTMDGLNVHGVIIDELHAHKTRGVVDVLETATGARTQPLQFEITTAGFRKLSICREHRDYSEQVLRGIVKDDTWFAFVAELDRCPHGHAGPHEECPGGDDWKDMRNWGKANPNLGISAGLDDLERKFRKALETPAAQNSFRRLHLDEWTQQEERAIDMDSWDECGEAPPELDGRECFGGLDLASTQDLAAFALVFPGDEGRLDVLMRFWVPKDTAGKRSDRDRVPYLDWARDGLVELTEGNVIDYDVIRNRIQQDGKRYKIREIGYDRWNATQLIIQLAGDGLTVVPTGMGYASMNAPTKRLLDLVANGKLRHGANPVLRWCASNLTVEHDPADNWKPSKAKSTEKIDGIVAVVLGISRAMLNEGPATSIYESRGIRTL